MSQKSHEPAWIRLAGHIGEKRIRALLVFGILTAAAMGLDQESWRWWREGSQSVKLSLALVGFIELLPRVNVWMLRCYQLLALFVGAIVISGYRPVGADIRSIEDAGFFIYENVWQLHPVIWFALAAWIMFVLSMWWMKSRLRTGIGILGIVFALIFRSSRNGGEVMAESAVILLAGLLLIILRHIHEVRSRHASGWQLPERPVVLLLPVGLVILCVVAPGFLAPALAPIFPGPQKAYQESDTASAPVYGDIQLQAMEAAEGQSEQNQQQEAMEQRPVFQVESAYPGYWRGQAYSFYNGRNWSKNASGGQNAAGVLAEVAPDLTLPPDDSTNRQLLETVKVRQSFRVLKEDGAFPVLFGAYPLASVESLDGKKGGMEQLLWSPAAGELLWMNKEAGSYPRTYSVVSEVPVLDEDALKKAGPAPVEQINPDYLQLPGILPPRVRQLAMEISSGAASPYEAAKKLEQYLKATYPYSGQPGTLPDEGEDMVDQFLFEQKGGFSDYYSSAMVVLSRINGIPARWVSGYATGQSDSAADNKQPQLLNASEAAAMKPRMYTVSTSDAHSWAELYFPGYGWLPFEPSPRHDLVWFHNDNQSSPSEQEEQTSGLSGLLAQLMLWGTFVLVGALVLFMGIYGIRWLIRRRRAAGIHGRDFPLPWFTGNLAPDKRVVVEYHKMLKLYRKKGVTVLPSETAREAISRLKDHGSSQATDLDTLLRLFETAKYSPRSLSAEECEEAVQIVKRAKKAV